MFNGILGRGGGGGFGGKQVRIPAFKALVERLLLLPGEAAQGCARGRGVAGPPVTHFRLRHCSSGRGTVLRPGMAGLAGTAVTAPGALRATVSRRGPGMGHSGAVGRRVTAEACAGLVLQGLATRACGPNSRRPPCSQGPRARPQPRGDAGEDGVNGRRIE